MYGAVHKVRHAIFTPSLCHTLSHIPGPPKSTSQISDPPIFSRPSTKTQTKALCSLSIVRGGILSGAFVKGSFVRKVLSGVVLVHSPFCQNTSATTES